MAAQPENHSEPDPRGAIRSFERGFGPGQIVFEEGARGDTLFVIQSGQIELSRARPDGRQILARLGPGEFFGEMAVLLGRPHAVRAQALADAKLIEIDAGTFEAMCVDRPEIAIRVIQRLASRVIELEQRLKALGADDLLRPVVRVIVRHAEPDVAGARFATTLRELAAQAGLTLLEAHQALSQLLDRKLVRLSDDVLCVPDVEALAASLDA